MWSDSKEKVDFICSLNAKLSQIDIKSEFRVTTVSSEYFHRHSKLDDSLHPSSSQVTEFPPITTRGNQGADQESV